MPRWESDRRIVYCLPSKNLNHSDDSKSEKTIAGESLELRISKPLLLEGISVGGIVEVVNKDLSKKLVAFLNVYGDEKFYNQAFQPYEAETIYIQLDRAIKIRPHTQYDIEFHESDDTRVIVDGSSAFSKDEQEFDDGVVICSNYILSYGFIKSLHFRKLRSL